MTGTGPATTSTRRASSSSKGVRSEATQPGTRRGKPAPASAPEHITAPGEDLAAYATHLHRQAGGGALLRKLHPTTAAEAAR